jgi:hypothetical protein
MLFNPATDLPPLATVEEVATWAIYTLQQHHKGVKIVETELGSEFVATTGIFSTPTGEERLLLRVTVPMKADWVTSTAPRIWKRVDQISQTQLQAAFKSNG